MTPQQEHIALQNFKTSMIASGHGDRLDFSHANNHFSWTEIQLRWLGYKRCWEEQVVGENSPIQHAVAPDYTPPNPAEEEFMFIGGPLHGLHMWDRTKRYRIVVDNNEEVLYRRNNVKGKIFYIAAD